MTNHRKHRADQLLYSVRNRCTWVAGVLLLLATAACLVGFQSAAATQAPQSSSATSSGTVSSGTVQSPGTPSGVPFTSQLPPFLHSQLQVVPSVSKQATGTVDGQQLSSGHRTQLPRESTGDFPMRAVRQVAWDETLQFFGPAALSRVKESATSRNQSGTEQNGSPVRGTLSMVTVDARQESRAPTDQQPAAPPVRVDEPPAANVVTVEAVAAQKAAAEKVPDLAEDVRMRLAKHFQRDRTGSAENRCRSSTGGLQSRA